MPGPRAAGWVWWGCMLTVTIVNAGLLAAALLPLSGRRELGSQKLRPKAEQVVLRVAAAIFTVVCGYRAILPRIDVPRICWFDSPLNWIVFGRLAATLAEVAWATQMGLQLRRLALRLRSPSPELRSGGRSLGAQAAARAQVAGIAAIVLACIAECCSWTNLITEDNLFAVFEQALWSVLFILIGGYTLTVVQCWPWWPASYLIFAVIVFGMGLEQAFEAFGLYLPRYLADQAHGIHYEGFSSGLSKLAVCAVVTQDIREWSSDAPWMTGYFSLGVWSSIWLAVAPLPPAPSVLTAQA